MPEAFPILIEVEQASVGPVLLLLNKTVGVAKIHLNFDQIGKKGAARKATSPKEVNGSEVGHSRAKRNPEAPTGKSLIITELVSGPKNVAHLKSVFDANGLSKGNVSSNLYELEAKNITERVGVGLHRLTGPFLEEWRKNHPSETPSLPAPQSPGRAARGASRPFVLQCVTDGKTRAEMNADGKALGINERMIDGALTRLKAEKVIVGKKDEPGVYVLAPSKVKPKQ